MTEQQPQELIGPLSSVERKNAPRVLFLQGDRNLLQTGLRVCVIGTRKPSAAGQAAAREYATFLVRNGVIVVSGLAMGIDTIAHRTALDAGGRTIAVLGTPLDQTSPRSNVGLQREIGEKHLLVSQFASGSQVTRANFPQRNRTMALLSDATIIIEAGEGSGTLHQGWEALRLGRPLFILSPVVHSGLEWPPKMLDYGAMALSEPTELYEALPIRMEAVGGAQAL